MAQARESDVKPHYFQQEKPDADDIQLKMAIGQGYVPTTCLLGGPTVMGLTMAGDDPCKGCQGPRERCHGRPNLLLKNR